MGEILDPSRPFGMTTPTRARWEMPYDSVSSCLIYLTRNSKPETRNSCAAKLRRPSHRNFQHRRCQRAAISAIKSQAVVSRTDNRLCCRFIDDVLVVDRLEHVGVVLVGNHVHLGVNIEGFDRAAEIG